MRKKSLRKMNPKKKRNKTIKIKLTAGGFVPPAEFLDKE
jgi:hypothetical protein